MSSTTQSAWPEGVIARYLTKAAEIVGDPTITVDVTETDDTTTATCRGCGDSDGNYSFYAKVTVTPWARKHAESCRAVPRSDGAR